jgi:hypothetical protein
MKEFELEHEDVIVLGVVVEVLLDAFGAYRARGEKVITRYFSEDGRAILPDGEYPAYKLLHALRDLQTQFGAGFMRRVGQHVYEHAPIPPQLETFESVLAELDQVYQANHQNGAGRIGSYAWTKVADDRGRMVCDNPYPCAFDMGLLAGVSKQFDVEITLAHEDEATCRHLGGDQCTYVVEWRSETK